MCAPLECEIAFEHVQCSLGVLRNVPPDRDAVMWKAGELAIGRVVGNVEEDGVVASDHVCHERLAQRGA